MKVFLLVLVAIVMGMLIAWLDTNQFLPKPPHRPPLLRPTCTFGDILILEEAKYTFFICQPFKRRHRKHPKFPLASHPYTYGHDKHQGLNIMQIKTQFTLSDVNTVKISTIITQKYTYIKYTVYKYIAVSRKIVNNTGHLH